MLEMPMAGVVSNLGKLINLGYVRTPDDEVDRIAAFKHIPPTSAQAGHAPSVNAATVRVE